MSWMSMSQEGGQALANTLSEDRPSVGRRVTIEQGKHKGKVGVVFWHGKDGFAGRAYGSPFQQSCSDIMGRYRYRVGVKTDDGQQFFTKAEYTAIVKETAPC